MKVNESDIRKIIRTCWSRGTRYKRHFGALAQVNFYGVKRKETIGTIKIKFGPIRKDGRIAVGLMCQRVSNKNRVEHIMCIDNTIIKNKKDLEFVVAHELSHFIDHCDNRVSRHDFNFLHNMLVMLPEKRTHEVIVKFLHAYCISKKAFKKYTDVLK